MHTESFLDSIQYISIQKFAIIKKLIISDDSAKMVKLKTFFLYQNVSIKQLTTTSHFAEIAFLTCVRSFFSLHIYDVYWKKQKKNTDTEYFIFVFTFNLFNFRVCNIKFE